MHSKLTKFVSNIALFLLTTPAIACEISLTSDKEQYQLGDVAVVSAKLIDTHRDCTFKGKEPKVAADGLELTAKTKYKETSPGEWFIKYKFKISAVKNQVTVYRDNCTKGGGTKSLSLSVAESGVKK